MKAVFKQIYHDRNATCQNCGRWVSLIADSFAHIRGKRLLTKKEKVDPKYIVLVCPVLHHFQTRYAENLKTYPCVKLFLEKYGYNGKNFYGKMLDESNNK